MNRTLKFTLTVLALALSLALVPSAGAQTPALGPTQQVVAFVATPVFDASKANEFVLTLTGAVTSSTLINGSVGETVSFVISQDATGSRTFVAPTNINVFPTIKSAANAVTYGEYYFDGAIWQPVQPVTVHQIAAYTNATTTFSSVPELSWTVAASRNQHAVCRLTWQGSSTTTGPKYQFTGPASPTNIVVGLNSPITAATAANASAVAFSSPVANTGTNTATTNFTDTLDLGVINGTTAGIVQLQAAANGAGTLTLQPGSGCVVTGQ